MTFAPRLSRAGLGALVAAALILLAAFAPAASAQGVATRRAGVHWRGAVPVVYVSIRDVANSAAAHGRLMSGLPQQIVLRVVAYKEGSTPKPLAVHLRSCRVVYDLWEESFRGQLESELGDTPFRAKTVEEVLERCAVLRGTPIGEARHYTTHRGAAVYFGAVAELNPLSTETVRNIRRWLARPGSEKMEGDAFFGSFVSMFVSQRIGGAERTIRFRTPSARVP